MTEIIGTLYQMEGVAKVNRHRQPKSSHMSKYQYNDSKSLWWQESAADRAQSIFSTLDFDGWFKNKKKSSAL